MKRNTPGPSFSRRPSFNKKKRPGKEERIRQRNQRVALVLFVLLIFLAGIIIFTVRQDQKERQSAETNLGFGEDITEAKCMENYLIAHGIKKERLVLEEKSTNTKENLKFSDALTGCSRKNTGILSNNFHVYRAVKLAAKLGYEHPHGIAAASDPIMQVHYVVRETAALVKEKLRGNI